MALATVALAAVFPAASVWFTTRAMLFHQPVIIADLAALVLAEQLAEDDVDRRGRAWRRVGIGTLLGVGWWASTQVLFFAIPVVVWLEQARSADLIARLPEHVGISEEFDVGLFHVIVPARNVPPELLPAASVPG